MTDTTLSGSPSRTRAVAVLAVLAMIGPFAGLVLGRAAASQPAGAQIARPSHTLPATTSTVEPASAASDPTDAGLELRLTSQDGRWQAWSEPLPEGATIYAPGGRAETTLLVRDKLDGSTTTFTFAANLEPEAFSPDGATLYLIDHQPALDPEIYHVAALEIGADEIRRVLAPQKVPIIEEMRGTGRQQVWAPAGHQLYTLYVRQRHVHDDGTVDAHSGLAEDAFIHVLDVEQEWAICLELPAGFGLGPAGTADIFLADNGATITVVDHHIGQQIEIAAQPRGGERTRFDVGQLTPVAR